jgi:hypothetical protein
MPEGIHGKGYDVWENMLAGKKQWTTFDLDKAFFLAVCMINDA